jgi:hypothetical protein
MVAGSGGNSRGAQHGAVVPKIDAIADGAGLDA